jgi:hypothetical protein
MDATARTGPERLKHSRARWVHEVSTVAAYRERWHISGQRDIGSQSDVGSTEQMEQRQRAQIASERAVALVREPNGKESSMDWEPNSEVVREVEL